MNEQKRMYTPAILLAGVALLAAAQAQEARIDVQADRAIHPVSRFLTGACLEDVNHEVYGGIYSQMVFGESFQEPPITAIKGFKAYGGNWRVRGEELYCLGSAGDKLVSELPLLADGEVGVEVFVPDRQCSNAGLIVRVDKAGAGADNFDGYEIALNAADQNVRLGRHRHNWEPIQDTPCEVPLGQWVPLAVRLEGPTLEVLVSGKAVLRHEDRGASLASGTIGLRQYQTEARYRRLWVKINGQMRTLAFASESDQAAEVSGMWRRVQTGGATGSFAMETDHPYVGRQSQRVTFVQGQGQFGVENQGLNRWGMSFVEGKPYEGVLWARAEAQTDLFVALENKDGSQSLAEQRLSVAAGDWQRLTFTLTPARPAYPGRLAVTLRGSGSVVLGYAFLQPGEWGRFKGLPVRRDVAEALIGQGITVLRYGGSMINHPEYRWKKMIGPRDRRPPYRGTWYPHSSNGWGILDFMDFCEQAGFEYIPAFNMGETPQDMADFMEYAKGPTESEWGRRRAAEGHAQPYRLHTLELGNEERVDAGYASRFEPLAKAIWAKDPEVTLVVGDFAYGRPIEDPCNFRGAAGGITSLAGQQRILRLAKQADREVWFDVHVGTDGPRPDFGGTFTYIDALARLAEGARHKVVIFEFNAGNHSQRRALANAMAINWVARDGRLPISTSANCLQPDGQNDNDWNQGLLFLNPAQVWLQPPGYVTRMFSRNSLPQCVQCQVTGDEGRLDAVAQRSEDGKTLVLTVVNPGGQPAAVEIRASGFAAGEPIAHVTELAGALEAVNTAERPSAVVPVQRDWRHAMEKGATHYTFPAHSFTVIRFE
jgi:hypothetical protein